jgi:hypothetical protein
MKIYEQVKAKINQGDVEGAVALLQTIEDRETQLKVLQLLDRDLLPDFAVLGHTDAAYLCALLRQRFVAGGFHQFLQRLQQQSPKQSLERSINVSLVMQQFIDYLLKKPSAPTSTKIKIAIEHED